MRDKSVFSLDVIEDLVCVLLLAFTAVVVFAQVAFRYVLKSPIVWAEELSTVLFAWITFLGSAIATRKLSHLSIDALVTLLPAKIRCVLQVVVDVLVTILLLLFVKSGLEPTIEGRGIATSTLGISQSWVYLAGPVGGLLMLYHQVANLLNNVRKLVPKKGSSE